MKELAMTVKQMNELAIVFRGRYIHLLVEIERAMEIYIAQKLTATPTQADDLVAFALGSQNMKAKTETFRRTVEKFDPNVIISQPLLFQAIDKASDSRNIFAHSAIDFSRTSIDDFLLKKQLNFIKLKALKPGPENKTGEVNVYAVTEAIFDASINETEILLRVISSLIEPPSVEQRPTDF